MALLIFATLAGATLQSAAGFGFALVVAPVALSVFDPDEAITTLLVLGAALNLLVLFSERRPRRIRTGELPPLIAWAVPGLIAGAVTLAVLSQQALQVAVGVLVISAAATQARTRPRRADREVEAGGSAMRALTGIATGFLTTTTGTSGPPLLLWFERIGATPAEIRDSLGMAFLLLNGFGVLALLVPGSAELRLDGTTVAILLVATVCGQVAGRALFTRLDPIRFRAIGLTLVVATGMASIAAGLAG